MTRAALYLNPVGTGWKADDRGHFRVRYVCSESS